jgi:hypothetical protein
MGPCYLDRFLGEAVVEDGIEHRPTGEALSKEQIRH